MLPSFFLSFIIGFFAKFKTIHLLQVSPKFCKQYACVGKVIKQALLEYKEDVINGSFPGSLHIPYKICQAEANGFINELQRLGLDKAASAAFEAVQTMDTSKSNGEGQQRTKTTF